ncbi:MAG: hypothetical protein V4676_11935 [Bacteroidota bacterium]
MKNKFFLAIAAILFTVSLNAQTTADSIAAKYKLQPMPEALTLEKAFPALGTYQLSGEGAGMVNITIDSLSKGIVWIEGLPQGKMKAYLKQSPSTYRIVSQKTADGKTIPEGTLIYDAATSTLNVALGKAFDDANPAEIFAMNTMTAATPEDGTEVKVKTKSKTGKTKTKVTFYSATKAGATTTSVGTMQ